MKICFYAALLLSLLGCSRTSSNETRFEVTIDWVPSAEYYGFFVAKHEHLYEQRHLDVMIHYGSGAPAVANQIAVGTIYAGTTTSDNILRQIARGGTFSRAVPVLNFNPSVVVSLQTNPLTGLTQLKGRRIGVNQQSSVYQQFEFLLARAGIKKNDFSEYPIGFGGAEQLKGGQVDSILAYATNVMMDLVAAGDQIAPPLYFSDKGVQLYGQVLVFGAQESLQRHGIQKDTIQDFIEATQQGMRLGAANPTLAATCLLAVEPTLDRKKLELAVKEIADLNSTHSAEFSQLDRWLENPGITDEVRQKAADLYK